MFGISGLMAARYTVATAVLAGAGWFDLAVMARQDPWYMAEQLLIQAIVAVAAAGLSLTWEAGRRRRVAARTGLDRLMAALPVAVYQGLLTPDGRFNRYYLTPSIVRVTGWTAEQLPEHADLIALVPPPDRSIADAQHENAARDGEAISEYRMRRPDNRLGWFRHQTRVMASTEDGLELIGTLSDITAAHELAEQTAANEARFRGFLEASPDAVVVTDEAGAIVMVSQRVEALFGYRPEEIVGKPHSVLVPESRRMAHADHVRDYVNNPEARDMGLGRELHARRQDGSEFPAEISLSPYRSPEGLFVVTAIRDVTQRQQAQEQLRQAQKMEAVGQLTGGVAHDFNNLLTTILGNTELLEWDDKAFDAETRALISAIGRAAQRAALLTRQLLAFSRDQPLKPELTDLNLLIGGMVELLRRTLGGRVSVSISLAEELWKTLVDNNQFENAILNLAINARDAMPDGGQLTIETGNTQVDGDYAHANDAVRAGPYVMITVGDTGSGMTKAVLRRAFDPFYTTKPVGKGTGLGLSQVYGFVKQSGGHIKLESVPDKGTTVRIYLPRHLANDEIKPSVPIARTTFAGGTETLLIVEDEPAVREFSVKALQRLGYHVLEADRASSAMTLLENEPGISLLFTDIGLPGVNGRQLANEARRRYPALRILLTSGYERNAAQQSRKSDYSEQFLPKPFTIDVMARQIREILDSP